VSVASAQRPREPAHVSGALLGAPGCAGRERNATRGVSFVEVHNVSKRFGELEVLKHVSLEVPEHNVVCLIGASGSGKSTLLRCLNLLERVEEGEIVIDGQTITNGKVDVNALRRKIGIVFQAYNLFPHMTVLENITLAPTRVRNVGRRDARERANEMLARIGLSDKADEFPDRLSGGQQQRVAIARALAMEPKLMLLDEITSALDPQLVADVLNLVRELAESGMTMIVATHEMSFAREVADKVCFLDAGVICEEGVPAQIFTEPREPRTREFLSRIIAAGRL
jgi:polar amino acid transport system ATP-binding protein